MSEVEGKTCPDCGTWKEADDFHKDSSHGDGLKTCCKDCRNGNYSETQQKEFEGKYNEGDTTIDHCDCGNYYKNEKWVGGNLGKWEIYDECKVCREVNLCQDKTTLETTVKSTTQGLGDHQNQSKKEKSTIVKNTSQRSIKNVNESVTKLEETPIPNTEKKNWQQDETITNETKKSVMKNETNIDKKINNKPTNDSENGMQKTEEINSTNLKSEETNLIPQEDLSEQSLITKMETSQSMNLIDSSIHGLHDSMKELAKSPSSEENPTYRQEVMVKCAKELRGMMRLKLDTFKFAHELHEANK